MKKCLCASALIILLLLSFTACTPGSQGNVNFGDYEIPSDYDNQNNAGTSVEPGSSTGNYNAADILSPDTSWQNAYALSYSYYDIKTGESVLTEGKCGKYYQISDSSSDITTFLVQEDAFMIQYMLDTVQKNGTSAIITDGAIENAYSGFTLLSVCDPYFPVYKNVTRVGNDFVGKRPATRFKQVETKDGSQTRIAYVWIDDEFHFASKCELYDAVTEELLMRWELKDFTTNITEAAVKINVDAYNITKE